MSNYAIVLELRRKSIGGWHVLHILLTLMTIVWVIVYIAHAMVNYIHNRKLDKQIDRVMTLDAIALEISKNRNTPL